jgi:hypothetical protein
LQAARSFIEDRQINGIPLAGEEPPATVPEFVNHMIATMTSPEEELVFGVEPRATQDEVDGSIGNFQLHTGPADVPAFYDFHSLQIAYDYVWQKAIDDGVIESAKALSRKIQEMGGNPAAALESGSDPVRALRSELRTVQAAHADSNLTQLMSTTNRASLRINQSDVGNVPVGGVFNEEGGGGGGVGPIFDPGNVITFPPGTVFDTGNSSGSFPHQLLNQIESLLNERFAFEVFAPGSVNFGILVTYRQRWTPVNYQVGDLIKTITLTP